MTLHDRCSSCGLPFDPTPGSTWGFWVVGDRIFVVAALLPIYFGLALESWISRGLLLIAIAVPLVATMPNRQGFATALDYFTSERRREGRD
jgi:hypothetical protein